MAGVAHAPHAWRHACAVASYSHAYRSTTSSTCCGCTWSMCTTTWITSWWQRHRSRTAGVPSRCTCATTCMYGGVATARAAEAPLPAVACALLHCTGMTEEAAIVRAWRSRGVVVTPCSYSPSTPTSCTLLSGRTRQTVRARPWTGSGSAAKGAAAVRCCLPPPHSHRHSVSPRQPCSAAVRVTSALPSVRPTPAALWCGCRNACLPVMAKLGAAPDDLVLVVGRSDPPPHTHTHHVQAPGCWT